MSINTKIFIAFMVIMVVAVILGVIGWRTSRGIGDSLETVVHAELPLNDRINLVGRDIEAISAAQRSLLNPNFGNDVRQNEYGRFEQYKEHLLGLIGETDRILDKYATAIPGLDKVRERWLETRKALSAWMESNQTLLGYFAEWEKTTIINPNRLLADLQRYRGDHYSLATRLGRMVAEGRDAGPEINPSDTICAFGRWRVSFDEGKEPFSGNPVFVKAMAEMVEPHRVFHQTARKVQDLVRADPEGNRRQILDAYIAHIDAANDVISHFDAMLGEAAESQAAYDKSVAFVLKDLDAQQSDLARSLEGLVAENWANIERNSGVILAAGRRDVAIMLYLTIGTVALSILLSLFVRWVITSSLIKPLNRIIDTLSAGANELGRASDEFAETSGALARGAGEQDASLEETASALEEVAQMTKKNAESTQDANSLMTDNGKQVGEGVEAVSRMGGAMDEINDSSEKISRIIKTIEDISFQTNLLALNASVEAARAGDAGKGFAVVAEEVRNLAQRSAQASRDTASLIEITVARIKTGSEITGDIEKRFDAIASSTGEISRLIGEISVSTAQQSQGMDQIGEAVSRIKKVTEETSGNATRCADASEDLGKQVDSLLDMVVRLEGVMGRRRERSRNRREGGEAEPRAETRRPMLSLPAPRE